jgi:hypothetical protein
MRLPDGSLRMWYASRKKPPFLNKYFAINTALWKTPGIGFPPTTTSRGTSLALERGRTEDAK